MLVLDREPTADIGAVFTPLEDPLRPALSEVPQVFIEAFTSQPQAEAIVGIGRNRIVDKLFSTVSAGLSKIKDSVYWLKYRKGRGGRGECPGCSSGTEDNHHGGSRCRKRGTMGFDYKSLLTLNILKPASIPSGL